MRLYNENTDRIEEVKSIVFDGSNMYADKMSETDRNSAGYYNLAYGDKPNAIYYTFTESSELVGNIYTTTYTPIEKPLQYAKDYKLGILANKAVEVEEQGITVSGLEIATDVKSQAKLTTAITFFGRKPDEVRIFKTKNGFAEANKATVEAIQDALDVHLVSVTANEKVHFDSINLLETVGEIESYDISIGW